ncbi:Oxidoreductase-like protein, N-terminal family protein [Clavispora lusitaniae]|uniref:Oxidoreductase-like domain-containing protein n=1 Tax=Clavispora lusitaniae (strain ATCC 42720) TaxID=306902 RepID=C4Y7Z9_CLAL4|nr:uncharacterized protein CLUG_04327 [Clavispora lusitaniae ATCC 42720]EEQ40199.1 hypothetical protein CLUG_04327 [Clavispora lusitaniae ATCC 42720]KAF5209815.1 hypothetical protein E0198_004129 [Clavispora lusitaniae]KAF7581854.1 Oxidoreductase-like protein, N-terminal family protein [Clavispora lusitaniae]
MIHARSRGFSLARAAQIRFRSKYAFYDLVLETPTHPREPIEASLMKEDEKKQLKKESGATFEGAYSLDNMTAEEKIARVFGGRIRGDRRESSSRMNVGKPRVIAGVQVPAKPVEPDNCCMSGCINCVWEMYNDDVKDWNTKRKKAAAEMVKRGGIWPADFHPPVRYLKKENLPQSVRQSAEARKPADEEWGNVPVSIRVFAEMERKKKLQKQKREQNATP